MLAPAASKEDLGPAHGESVFGAQGAFDLPAFLFRKRTYEDWSFHGPYCNPSTATYPEDALGKRMVRCGQEIEVYDVADAKEFGPLDGGNCPGLGMAPICRRIPKKAS